MKKSLVYTRTGDQGQTGLIGGTRIPKDHMRLEAYGTIDELNSHIGVIWSYPIDDRTKEILWGIQNQLFVVGAYLATDDAVSDLRNRLKRDPKVIEMLEQEMDVMENALPPLTNFILPGGHPAVAACHVSRTVARRAERRVIHMGHEFEVDPWVIRYLNRLSDYLFVLSRHLSKYFNATEIPWKPEL
ncbi:MAG: cob(I)yrinic acid a,c-diamide adenosyltransferase [Breznakibacter sp.]